MNIKAIIEIDGVQTVLSDRDYASQPLNWLIIENAKVDAMIMLNKIVPMKEQHNIS